MNRTNKIKRRPRTPSVAKTDKTRAIIIEAAMQEFFINGYAETTLTKIAARADIARGTPYSYFTNKEALFASVVRHVITNPLKEAEQMAIAPEETVANFIRRTLLPAMQVIERDGRAAIARLIIAEGPKFPQLLKIYVDEVYNPLLVHIRRLADLAFQRKEITDDYLIRYPHLLVAPLWVGMINNGIMLPNAKIDIAEAFDIQISLLFG